jgi:sulfite dehydrogenase (quinone) subunit SoeC
METIESNVWARQQQEWRFLIIIALFFTGSGAGLFLFSLIPGFLLGMAFGVVSVMVGCLFLWADLHRPLRAWRLLTRPQSSWMSRGVIGISAFTVLALLYIVFLAVDLHGWTSLGSPWEGGSGWMKALGILAGVGALYVSCYPGFLLGSVRPISFWNGAYLPALFLASSLLGGLGFLFLLPLNWEGLPWLHLMPKVGIVLVIFELLLFLGLMWMSHAETTKRAVYLLIHGSLRLQFLGGVLGLGLIAPLVIIGLMPVGAGITSYLVLEGVLHLIGVFFLRYVVIRAGIQVSPA